MASGLRCSAKKKSIWKTSSWQLPRESRTRACPSRRARGEQPLGHSLLGTHTGQSFIMHILFTGGAGYIGSHAVRLFLSRGHDVWVYDNLSEGHRAAVPADRLLIGDLAEIQRLDQVLVERRIEAAVHFAAFAYVGESVKDPGKYYQ